MQAGPDGPKTRPAQANRAGPGTITVTVYTVRVVQTPFEVSMYMFNINSAQSNLMIPDITVMY